ncbi:MAG: hypothetical protein M1541_16490, partial [Acidobacteria bacterium]|nr:hypothetical protein [Acidobacteriota bacterium]
AMSVSRYASFGAFLRSVISERLSMYAGESSTEIQAIEADIKAKQDLLRQRRQALVTVTDQ